MGVDDLVVDMTRHYRGQRWPGTEGWYVVSGDGGGSPIGMDQEGRVWLSDHGDVVAFAASFEAFVLQLLK